MDGAANGELGNYTVPQPAGIESCRRPPLIHKLGSLALSDKLVERLRERCENGDYEYWYKKAPGDMEAAADRIEELERALRDAHFLIGNELRPEIIEKLDRARDLNDSELRIGYRMVLDHIDLMLQKITDAITPSAEPERQ
jgi:hypothetical protein